MIYKFYITDFKNRLLVKTVTNNNGSLFGKNYVIVWLAKYDIPKFKHDILVLDLRPFTINVKIEDIIYRISEYKTLPEKMKYYFFTQLNYNNVPKIETPYQRNALRLFYKNGHKYGSYKGLCYHLLTYNRIFKSEYLLSSEYTENNILAVIPVLFPKTLDETFINNYKRFAYYNFSVKYKTINDDMHYNILNLLSVKNNHGKQLSISGDEFNTDIVLSKNPSSFIPDIISKYNPEFIDLKLLLTTDIKFKNIRKYGSKFYSVAKMESIEPDLILKIKILKYMNLLPNFLPLNKIKCEKIVNTIFDSALNALRISMY